MKTSYPAILVSLTGSWEKNTLLTAKKQLKVRP